MCVREVNNKEPIIGKKRFVIKINEEGIDTVLEKAVSIHFRFKLVRILLLNITKCQSSQLLSVHPSLIALY